MRKSQLQKLILQQKKAQCYFASPEKIPQPGSVTFLDRAGLTEREKVCFVLNNSILLPKRRIAFYLGISHTTVNKDIISAEDKLKDMSISQGKKAEEDYSDKHEIEEMFKKHSLYETEKRDRQKAPIYRTDYYEHGERNR